MDRASWRERVERLRVEVHALALALRDDRTPRTARAVALLVVAYAASPVDPIPDVIPVVGLLDELVVLPVGVAAARRLVPGPVMADARARADEADLPASRTARWLGGGLVVLGWVVIVVLGWQQLSAPG